MRLLVVKLSSLGDVLHALPVVHRLADGLGAEVDWVTQPEYVPLVRCVERVDRVIPFPRRRFLSGLGAFRRAVRDRDYGLVLDLQGLLKSAVAARLARGERVVGVARRREGAGWLVSDAPPARPGPRHAVDRLLDVAEHLGLARTPVEFRMRALRAEAGPGRHVGMVPFSRWAAKNWPATNFAEAARAIRARSGAAVHLFGGPSDAEGCAGIAAAAGEGVENRAGRTGLPELAGWLAAMDAVLSVDSGPMHLAAAMGTPVVALFGPTDPRLTGPYGPGHVVITPPGHAPDHRYKGDDDTLIRGIAVESAVQGVLGLLSHVQG